MVKNNILENVKEINGKKKLWKVCDQYLYYSIIIKWFYVYKVTSHITYIMA